MAAGAAPAASQPVGQAHRPRAGRRLSPTACLLLLGVLLVASFVIGATSGAYAIDARSLPGLLAQGLQSAVGAPGAEVSGDALVFFHIRLPRLCFGLLAGAALGAAGALLQGLVRNPLADPALIGVSSGAAAAAAATIVLGVLWWPLMPRTLGSAPLVAAAFAGGLAAAALIQAWAQVEGHTRLALMLLAGIAVNALAGAVIGWLSFLATDEQLRSIQFWLLGSLAAARWQSVGGVAVLCVLGALLAWPLARGLNALALGEEAARALGVRVESVKRRAVLASALAVAAVSATAGIIGFIGLVAPHAVRLVAGPDHRIVLPGSALLGAALVLLADAVARSVAAPAEVPLGVITALIGAPCFLVLLRRERHRL